MIQNIPAVKGVDADRANFVYFQGGLVRGPAPDNLAEHLGLAGITRTLHANGDTLLLNGGGLAPRLRVVADDAADDMGIYEILQAASTTGQISFALMSDDLAIRQHFMSIDRDDKIYYDFDYTHPDDTAVAKATLAAGGGTGGGYITIEVNAANAPVNGGAIRGVSGDPEGTLVIGADTYGAAGVAGVTVSTVPETWLPHADAPGNFDDLMGNWPSNARMVRRIKFVSDSVVFSEKSSGTGLLRGLHAGMVKPDQLITLASDRGGDDRYYKNTDISFILMDLQVGALHIGSRHNEASPQDIYLWTGGQKRVALCGTDSANLHVGGETGTRRLHVTNDTQFVARIEASGSTRSEIELLNTGSAGVAVRLASSNKDFLVNVGGNDAFRVLNGAGASVLTVQSGGPRVVGSIYIGGVETLSGQVAAVANATGAGDIVAQFNTLLANMRAKKILAT